MGKTTGDIFDSLLWQHLRAPHWLPLKNSVRGAKETRSKNSWCLAARHLLFLRLFVSKILKIVFAGPASRGPSILRPLESELHTRSVAP